MEIFQSFFQNEGITFAYNTELISAFLIKFFKLTESQARHVDGFFHLFRIMIVLANFFTINIGQENCCWKMVVIHFIFNPSY